MLGNPLYFQNAAKQNQVGDLEKSLDKQGKIRVRNKKKEKKIYFHIVCMIITLLLTQTPAHMKASSTSQKPTPSFKAAVQLSFCCLQKLFACLPKTALRTS